MFKNKRINISFSNIFVICMFSFVVIAIALMGYEREKNDVTQEEKLVERVNILIDKIDILISDDSSSKSRYDGYENLFYNLYRVYLSAKIDILDRYVRSYGAMD